MMDMKSSWNSLTDKKAPRKLGKREEETCDISLGKYHASKRSLHFGPIFKQRNL